MAKKILLRAALGAVVGGLIGVVPGVLSFFVPLLAVQVGYPASGLVVYTGLLIGAAAGAVVGSVIGATEVIQGGGKAR